MFIECILMFCPDTLSVAYFYVIRIVLLELFGFCSVLYAFFHYFSLSLLAFTIGLVLGS
jgi:hypothetical protein